MWYLSNNIGRYVRAYDLPALELLDEYVHCVKLHRWLPERGYDYFVEELKKEILSRRGLELPEVPLKDD